MSVWPAFSHAHDILVKKTLRALSTEAATLEAAAPSDAASRHFQASLFYDHAFGRRLRARPLGSFLGRAKSRSRPPPPRIPRQPCRTFPLRLLSDRLGPSRIDFGGGWSDTPPFCLDWGGTVFNMAITIDGAYPIRTIVRQLSEPGIRLISSEAEESVTAESFLATTDVESPFAIHRAALQMLGFVRPGEPSIGLEIRTEVNLPMGSGLGTSSVLAATVLKALLSLRGEDVGVQELSDMVLALEQFMTTGRGWQDQVGGIYPGAKLTMTGPRPRQRLRVEPVPCPAGFAERFVLYYTGIRRIAKDLLGQVVGRDLAREVQAVQVLHSIKTLAVEMATP